MADLWYALVAFTLIVYVILDGYDFGAGMLHRLVARSEVERRDVLAAIGPYWDGNEVWLLAAGGALFVAFPAVLAAGLSGFYFAIFLLLWCLMGRGVAIELRSHLADPLWRSFWDTIFAVTSLLLALLFGVALGNVVRGVPVGADGWFSLALFTDFRASPPVGILDWYTAAVGVFAVVALLAHGAAFLVLETDGTLRENAALVLRRALTVTGVAWPLVTFATARVRPDFFAAFFHRPLAWLAIAIALAGFVLAFLAPVRKPRALAFAGTSGFLGGLLAATAICAWPALLYSLPDPARSLTAGAAAAPQSSLRIALAWYPPGLALAIGYQVIVARIHSRRSFKYGEAAVSEPPAPPRP